MKVQVAVEREEKEEMIVIMIAAMTEEAVEIEEAAAAVVAVVIEEDKKVTGYWLLVSGSFKLKVSLLVTGNGKLVTNKLSYVTTEENET